MLVLGIETSCDETAAAIVTDQRNDGSSVAQPAAADPRSKRILSEALRSQIDDHQIYGGVVPEIAARSHVDHLDRLVALALQRAGLRAEALDAVAATAGPGLIGGVLVGATFAKAFACALGKPFVAVNHLAGHALSARLAGLGEAQGGAADGVLRPGTEQPSYPFLLLLVSGGHCQILEVAGPDSFRRLGTTIDDAAGEAFDKSAKLLGLPYPGGPAVEQAARSGDPTRFALPRPMVGRPGCDFSFSGLKAAVRREAEALRAAAPDGELVDQDVADLCASFQEAVAACLIDRLKRAAADFLGRHPQGGALVVAGGVAANQMLRQRLQAFAAGAGLAYAAPPLGLCTDNAAMIAWAGLERLRSGVCPPEGDSLAFKARPRWPLDAQAPKRPFAGVKA
ncbi:MAG: tRNA (adenosine(37)-N6)-threonylcarbamoyltransferase complex transferase subunit TsaD [Rhodospirillaceae bacterium]